MGLKQQGADIIECKQSERLVRDDNGIPDIHIAKQTEALSQNEQRFRKAFQSAVLSMCLVSLEGNFLAVNSALCLMFGYSEIELFSRTFPEITYPADLNTDHYYIQQLIAGDIPYYHLEKRYLHKHGHIIWSLLSVSLVCDSQDKPLYFICQIQDITQRKHAESVLRESDAILRSFYNNASMMMGVVELMGNDIIHISDNAATARFFGLTPEIMVNKKASEIGVPKEVLREWVIHYRQCESTGSPIRFEYTYKTASDAKWFSATFSPIPTTNGNRVRFSYVIDDITERKQAQEQLQQANAQLTSWVKELEERNRDIALLGKLSDILQACLTFDEVYKATVTLVKHLFPEVSGGVFVLSSSKNYVEAVATWGSSNFDSKTLFSPDECWALRRGRSHLVEVCDCGLECNHIFPDSSSIEYLCIPMMAQGEALGILYLSSQQAGLFTQARQQIALTVAQHIGLALAKLKLYEALQQQSIRDPLTGLFNRRYLEESLEREIKRATRASKSLAIIMLDVDYFKRFNDTFGHEAGDVVLRELGTFIQKQIRGSDIACRYGGEELVLLLPEASLEVATTRAEAIREGVKNLLIKYHRQPLGAITVSLGVACYPDDGSTGEDVIRAADEALYRAKQLGRDCVVTALEMSSVE